MSEKRTWDESRSPQWRYLLSKDSKAKRDAEKRREKAENELSRGIDEGRARGRRMRQAQERHQENRKLKTKSGREIVYSASPGGKNSSYRNEEFLSRKNINNEIVKNENTTTNE